MTLDELPAWARELITTAPVGRLGLVDAYFDDWSRLEWVELSGRVTILDARDAGDALQALAAKYPQYRTEPPPGPLLRLAPESFACWRGS